MVSKSRISPAIAGAIALVLSAAPAGAQKALVASIVYESPSLIAPAIFFASSGQGGSAWRAGVAGWTVSGEWSRRLSPERVVVLSGGLTPMNAHSSDRIFQDGERMPELAYGNASAWIAGGVRLHPSPRWTSELRVLGQYERVDGLPEAELRRWRHPFVGIELAQTYQRIRAEDPLRFQMEGVRVGARVQAFTGTTSWGQATASIDAGHALGPLLLRGSATRLEGRRLDGVSRFLVGGSWELPGVHALYGHPYAAFRLDRGTLVRGGGDLRLAGDWQLGVRAGYLASPGESHSGGMLRIGTSFSGVAAYAGVAAPGNALAHGEWNRALLIVGMTAAVLP